jgi:hypothetical protein
MTTDGAKSTTLYNVEDHSCGDLPVPGSAVTGARAQAPTQMRYENLTVEKTLDEPGPKIHGAATRHLRYAIAYEAHAGGDSGKSLRGSIASEVWVAPALNDGAFAMWLGAAPRTGNPDADRRIADGMVAAKGAALKRIQRTTLRAEGGKEQTSTTTLEITRLSLHRPSAKPWRRRSPAGSCPPRSEACAPPDCPRPRRARMKNLVPSPRYTSPSAAQPSPVPRLYTKSLCSTLPAGTDSCFASSR